jgi:lysophospholipase L1-like esterase
VSLPTAGRRAGYPSVTFEGTLTEENHVARRAPLRFAAGALALIAAAGLVACGSSSTSSGPKASASAAPTLPATPGSGKKFYVSLGDSYAAGYQPTAPKVGSTTTNGFAYQVAAKGKVNGSGLTLVNFGCAGATTASLLQEVGCRPGRLGPDGADYSGKTQAKAAADFISAHRADVGLVTVSIGGNDVTACAKSSDVVGCLTKALVEVKANLKTLLTELRTATGAGTTIVGITYPDVILGSYTSTKPAVKALASLSVTAFKSLINPALQAAYTAVDGKFIDVTTATGAYTPFTQTTTLAPYGTVPVAVAKVCQLTFYCQFQDIHPRTEGYTIIAGLIDKALPAA